MEALARRLCAAYISHNTGQSFQWALKKLETEPISENWLAIAEHVTNVTKGTLWEKTGATSDHHTSSCFAGVKGTCAGSHA